MTQPSIAGQVVLALRDQGLTIATAESLTGGLVCAALVDVPGASLVVRGGIVAYATDLKAALLEVPVDLLAARGAVDPVGQLHIELGDAAGCGRARRGKGPGGIGVVHRRPQQHPPAECGQRPAAGVAGVGCRCRQVT